MTQFTVGTAVRIACPLGGGTHAGVVTALTPVDDETLVIVRTPYGYQYGLASWGTVTVRRMVGGTRAPRRRNVRAYYSPATCYGRNMHAVFGLAATRTRYSARQDRICGRAASDAALDAAEAAHYAMLDRLGVPC